MIKVCPTCKKEFYVRPCYIKKYHRGKYCSKSCSAKVNYKINLIMFKKGYIPWNKEKTMPQTTKEKHWNWKGGRLKYGSDRYIYVFNKQHPFATKSGYVAEHRLIMEKSIGSYLKPKERVHHKDGNKTNNKIDNLKLYKSESHHQKYHHPKGTPVHLS